MNTPATDRPQPAAAEPTNADNTNPDAMTLDPMIHEPTRSALPDGHGESTGHGEHGEHPAGEALAVAMKPLLRGWLHLVLAPLCLIGCLVLALLADPAGGLYMEQASPVMSHTFGKFADDLGNAIAALIDFADSFTGIADTLKDMDQKLAVPPKES